MSDESPRARRLADRIKVIVAEMIEMKIRIRVSVLSRSQMRTSPMTCVKRPCSTRCLATRWNNRPVRKP